MRRIRFKTIFSRMLFMQSITVVSAILVVGVVICTVVYAQRMQEVREQLQRQASFVADVLTESPSDTAAILQNAAESNDLLIEQVDAQGTLQTYCAAASKWTPYASCPLNETRCGDAALGETTRLFFKTGDLPILTLVSSAAIGEQTVTLLLHADLTLVNAHMVQTLLWVVLICLLGIVASVVVSYYNAFAVINPFVEINHTVQCYSRGDFSQRIAVQGKDEAAQLGRSFNEMAEQLRGLEDTRRSFVANVSHELRSPLTSMKGFLEAMHDGTIPKESCDEYIEIVLNETRRMTTMVNDLLDLARIESGTIELHYETFDINELVRRTLLTFEARLTEKYMEMDVRFAQEQCFVYADSAQIGQVLRNLIDNAIKYSPDRTTVCLSTYSMRKEVYVTVRDNGIGIPQEDVPHVFDRFYKVEKAHTPAPQVGSGLGLSIVKRIIEQHGQTITVRSARGRGTQFTFTLERASMMKRVTDGGKRNGT